MRQGRYVSLRRCQLSKRESNSDEWTTSHRIDGLKAILQCLYSQCQTSLFPTALHYALAACPSSAPDSSDTLPPLIRHQGLRNRNSPTRENRSGAQTASVSVSAHRLLARRSASSSVVVSSRPTRSIANLPSKTHSLMTTFPATFVTSVSSTQASNTTPFPDNSTF